MHDLQPAADALARLVDGIDDDQLDLPTPCTDTSVGDLLDHVDGLALAFAGAARKQPLEGAPSADGSRLDADWRPRIRARLTDLADAWRDPAAWSGMTRAGGIDLPGEVAGCVAVNEIVVHGWDLATATGQPFDAESELVACALGFVEPSAARSPQGTPGLFGPPVPVADDAAPLHRLVALTGRDPFGAIPPR